ncbi:MAG: diguanylate cyclase [Pyrinomonadaceae bacterium]
MNNKKASSEKAVLLESIAGANGVAIGIVDRASREVFTANANSICTTLNPRGGFSSACAEYCGRALEIAARNAGAAEYECHAGLQCRASLFGPKGKELVAIVGRVFVKADSYRKATARAMSGDWSRYPPTSFLENILIAGSTDTIGKASAEVEKIVQAGTSNKTETATAATLPPQGNVSAVRPSTQTADSKNEQRSAEASAWRSFFGSLLKSDYGRASGSILEFLAHHFGFSSLVWLERSEGKLTNTTAFGTMKNRKVRLGIAADDPRLDDAWQRDIPLELSERFKGKTLGTARTMYLFPIGVDGDISAAIAVLDPIASESTKTQISRICHSVAPQLEILRLRSELSRGMTLASAVRNFSESLKRMDNEDLWLNLTQNAAEMLRAERASLLIYDDKTDSLEIKALVGAQKFAATGSDVGTRVARSVLERRGPVAVADISSTGLPPATDGRQYKTSSFLSCPISLSGRNIGVMSFTDRAGGLRFDKMSLDLIQAISPQLAVAIDRAILKEKAGEFEQLSVTDALTGLLNRRYIEERLMEEMKRSTRHGFPMSFMMLDVDRFKSYNDQFGHPAGDEALKLVGQVIRDTLRGADVAARFGGEEFSILLPQTTGDEAVTIAERIRDNIEQAHFPHRSVTVSIGVASCSAELCISADLVSAADQALYEAKRAGRNRVLVFEKIRDTAQAIN